jgi:hypothetical protein
MMFRMFLSMLLLSAAASAQEGISVQMPPARFDHPFNGVTIEMTSTADLTRKRCREFGLINADACSWTRKNGTVCEIVIPTDGPVRDLRQYRRHETAHCNGWPGNHTP